MSAEKRAKIISMITVIGFAVFLCYSYFIRRYGYSNNTFPWGDFLFPRGDFLMDFFNINGMVANLSPYIEGGSSYPPFILAIAYLFSLLCPYGELTPTEVKVTFRGKATCLLLMATGVAIIVWVLYRMLKNSDIKKYWTRCLLIFLLLLSVPFLFMYDRGNYLIVAIVFYLLFGYYYEKNEDAAAVFLGIATAVKIYPALTMLSYLMEKKWKQFLISFSTCIVCSIIPLFFFQQGFIANLIEFFKCLLRFGGGNGAEYIGVYYGVGLSSLLRYPFFVKYQEFPDWFPMTTAYLGIGVLLTLVCLWKLRKEQVAWKKIMVYTTLMVFLTPNSYLYNMAFLLVPIAMMLTAKEKEVAKEDTVFLVLLALTLIPKAYYYPVPGYFVGINVLLDALILSAILLLYLASKKKIWQTKEGNLAFGNMISKSEEVTRMLTYFFFISMGILLLYFLKEFVRDFEGPQSRLFFRQTKDFMMDYFNVAYYAQDMNIYQNPVNGFGEKAYFPLTYVIFHFLGMMANYSNLDAYDAGHSTMGLTTAMIATIISTCVFFVQMYELREGKKIAKFLMASVLLCSGISLFTMERGNILLVAVILSAFYLTYYDSDNRILRELAFISLAIAAALKGYPALLGMLLVYDRRFIEAIRLAIYGAFFCFVPFLFFDGGFSNIPFWLRNLKLNGEAYEYANYQRFGYYMFLSNLKPEYEIYKESMKEVWKQITNIFAVLGVFAAGFEKTRWKQAGILLCLVILLATNSAFYGGMYLLPVIVMFFNEKEHSIIDFVYVILFVMLLNPYQMFDHGINHTAVYINLSVSILAMLLIIGATGKMIRVGNDWFFDKLLYHKDKREDVKQELRG